MEDFCLNSELNTTLNPDVDNYDILVSPICEKDGQKYAFVSFSQNGKSAEGRIPECKIISNNGFSESESQEIVEYMQDHLKELKSMAAGVNIFTAIMK